MWLNDGWCVRLRIEVPADTMAQRGIPEHIRSDNGPECVARDLRKWLKNAGIKTLYIAPGSPWAKLRDEFLNGEIFCSLKEVEALIEKWRIHYNTVRPHSLLGQTSPRRWQHARSK